MRKTWTAPTLKDFNVAFCKRVKLDDEFIDSTAPEPKSVDDLVVHSRKISEVRKWVAWSVKEKSPILLICGPPGSGKTVTLKLVADAEGLMITEWINPLSKTAPSNFFEEDSNDKGLFFDSSDGKKFVDFVTRSSRYPSLFEPEKRTLILVKDIPNAFIWKPELFYSFLDKYKISGRSPIAFIITDDEMDLHSTLFPNDIKARLGISLIKFNPVSDSLLRKNLRILSSKYNKFNNVMLSERLDKIIKSASGDLRSATTDALIELRTSEMYESGTVRGGKQNSTNDESALIESPLSSRDHGYDFYKNMGRVLYPKRNTETMESENGNLVHNVFEIAENWSYSYHNFLHENYLETCSKLKDATVAANYFSFCDVLARHKELEKYCSIIIVGGLMTENTQPKKRGFLPFKKPFNLNQIKDWKCKFNEASALIFGIEEKIFALDVAPLKKWLPVQIDSSVRTLSSCSSEALIKSNSLQIAAVKSEDDSDYDVIDTSEEEENIEISIEE